MRLKTKTLVYAMTSLLATFTLLQSELIGQQKTLDSNEGDVGGAPIYDADGSRAKNCYVLSVNQNSRVVALNSQDDGRFLPNEVNVKDSLALQNGVEKARALKNRDGVLPTATHPLAHLVVSEDGKQATFVPFNFNGNVQLRRCGKLRLDTSRLAEGDGYSIVVVWKNCLAGRYALNGTQTPGDPQNPKLDWRFRKFITAVSVLRLESEKAVRPREIYLPPGEVSVAVISDRQIVALEEFAQGNLSAPWKFDFSQIPATSGIHRVISNRTTTAQLQTGTCLKGGLVADAEGLPNWNDLGFVNASLMISDFWTSRLDWIPGYDLSKGVNHYFETLRSPIGRQVRARTLASTYAILKTSGQFMTYPLPNGDYQAHLYREGQTTLIPNAPSRVGLGGSLGTVSSNNEDSEVKMQKVKYGVTLISQSSAKTKFPKAMPHLVKVRVAVYKGDLSEAEKLLRLGKASEETSDFLTASLSEAEEFIARRKQLNQMFKAHDPDYNRSAVEFLLDVAVSLMQHQDFTTPEQIIENSKHFRVVNPDDPKTPKSTMKMLEEERVNVLAGKRQNPLERKYLLGIQSEDVKIKDVGLFKVGVPKFADETANSTYAPLQRLRHAVPVEELDQLASFGDQQSADYKKALASLRAKLTQEFEEKVSEREAELRALRNQLEAAESRLREHRANRSKIVERHMATELKKYFRDKKAKE